MRPHRPKLGISLPIVSGVITVLLSIALLVGWTIIVVRYSALTKTMTQNVWLLVIGIVSLVTIITVLVMLATFLVREMLEVRRQDSFIASVTHELKSPLASLKLCLETLERSELSAAHATQLRTMMAKDVERLSAFIDDILEASRIATRDRGHEACEVRLGPLCERCARAVENRYRMEPGQISVDVAADLWLASDPVALETVVRNLLDNAVKYSDTGAEVTVTARQAHGKTVSLEVRDNGIGIPRQHMRRIFDRFYRAPGEAVRTRRGTGLGLFVASALVRNLGGRIEASSAGAGRGTTMRVFLPVER